MCLTIFRYLKLSNEDTNNLMYTIIRRKFMRSIWWALVASLSMTSLAGASLIGGMVHGSDCMSESMEGSHNHHASEIASSSQTNHGMMNMHGMDTDSEEMMMCNLCALCTTIAPSNLVNISQHSFYPAWDPLRSVRFISSLSFSLDKPPRS